MNRPAPEPELLPCDAARAGIVLVPEVFGVDASLREYGARLVAEGYAVAMPEWWAAGERPALDTPDAIAAAVACIDDGRAIAQIADARTRLGGTRVHAVMGFCLGGLYARMAACFVPGFSASVEFYGRIVYPTLSGRKPIQPLDLLPGRSCAYLGHFGGEDPVAPRHHVDELESRLRGQPFLARIHRYDRCGHAFMNPRRPSFREAEAAVAWQRTLRFLDEVLPDRSDGATTPPTCGSTAG